MLVRYLGWKRSLNYSISAFNHPFLRGFEGLTVVLKHTLKFHIWILRIYNYKSVCIQRIQDIGMQNQLSVTYLLNKSCKQLY